MESQREIRRIISEDVLFAKEAAEFLSISTQRLNQLVHAGKIKPVKQTPAGTLFLKSDLLDRKSDMQSLGGDIKPSENNQKLKIDSKVLQEAVNYYTIQSLFGYSDKKTEPIFDALKQKLDMTVPLLNFDHDVSIITGQDKASIKKAYETTYKGFEKLDATDYVVKRGSELYPKLLEKTAEAPHFLFMRGNINLLNNKIVSVVGTRHPSEDGRNRAYRLSKLLGSYKITVASGLATGIDTAAHTSAIENNNLTIAVIGTPITKVYPKENEKLQRIISEKGLVISQFPPSAPVQRWHFPMRNAVMSGISLATVIIEAGETSGALKQADYALKQGRFVFIPQSALDNPNIGWPRKYITRPGAHKFSKIDELISKLESTSIIESDSTGYQLRLFSEGVEAVHVYRGQ